MGIYELLCITTALIAGEIRPLVFCLEGKSSNEVNNSHSHGSDPRFAALISVDQVVRQCTLGLAK
jgi:hypothetical protein